MRQPLPINTIIKMEDGSVFKVTGDPIGSGGLSLIYPAVKLINDKEKVLPYAIKECFLANDFYRDPNTLEIMQSPSDISDLETKDKEYPEKALLLWNQNPIYKEYADQVKRS